MNDSRGDHALSRKQCVIATAHQGVVATSALTLAEAARGIVRAKAAGHLNDAAERAAYRDLRTFQRRCTMLRVTRAVLNRAGRPFPVEPVRTLDAIHLAPLETLGDTPQLITVVTRDSRVRENARALGYAVA